MRKFVQEYPGILVSPAPASEVEEPRIKGVEEFGVTGFLYPQVWKPIPESHAPPQNIPAWERFSPSPGWTTFFIGVGVGLFIGLPLGREILKAGLRLTEREIRERIARVGR
jgi:hypothetical protein